MLEVVGLLPENVIKVTIFDPIINLKLQLVSKRTREYLAILLGKCATKLNTQMYFTNTICNNNFKTKPDQ